MKYLLVLFTLLFLGCGGNEKNILLATGKVPPRFIHITSKESMDSFQLDTRKYSLKLLASKEYDFKNGHFWRWGTLRDGNTIAIYNGPYHIDIFTPYLASEYTQKDKEIEEKIIHFRPQRTKPNGDIININTHVEYHGKENYPCVVSSSIDRFKRYATGYRCYKFNKERTKSKYVSIRLSYSKPTDPKLARIYTYADLKRRAKRMLDSLYIKDGW